MTAFTGDREPDGLDGLSPYNREVVKARRMAQRAAYPTWLEAARMSDEPVRPSGAAGWLVVVVGAVTTACVACGPALWALLGRGA